jgi:hypothetical protein
MDKQKESKGRLWKGEEEELVEKDNGGGEGENEK